MDSPHPPQHHPPGPDPRAAHIAHLESQLVISDATYQEELTRLKDELDRVYAECEGLRRAAAVQSRGAGGAAGAGVSSDVIRQMERTVSSLQNDNTHLEQTLQSLHTQHAHLLAQHTQTLSTLRGAELAYDALHTSHTSLETSNVDLRAELEDLQERFGALQRREGSLRQDWEILGEDYADLKDEIGLVHGEKRGLRQTIETQQARITELEESERTARDAADDLRAQLGASQYTAQSLRTRLDTLEASTADLTTRAEKAEQDRLQVQVERVEATLARDAAEETVERLRESVERAEEVAARHEETRDRLQSALAELRVEETAWRAEKESLANDLAAARTENGKLELKAEKQRTEETRLKGEVKNLKTERTGLQKRLKDAEKEGKTAEATSKEVTRLEEDVARLEGELNAAQKRAEELEGDVKKWEDECGKKDDEVLELEGAVHEGKEALAGAKEALASAETTARTEGKAAVDRIAQLESTIGKQKTAITEKETSATALQRRVTSLTADLKRVTAEMQGTKKEIVPLRLERDTLKNEVKKLGSERNLLRHSLDKLREGAPVSGTPAAGTASGTTTGTTTAGTTTNGSDPLTALQAEHAITLANHAAEITRLHDERQEFKKYIDWVRPDREKLKEELKNLRVAFEQSEAEKKMLMSEVTKYLSQPGDTKPILSPTGKVSTVIPASSPIKNGHQQHEQLVQALGIIEQEFTRYRTRVEEELAEGKSAIAQAEMEKSMVEEEFERFRGEQRRAREELEREVGKYKTELEKKQKVIPVLTREIHATIAGFLAGGNAFRSLANFSAVSREVRQTIMPILYETLVLDDDGDEDWAYGIRVDLTAGPAGLVLPSGWEHVQHLFMSHRHQERIKTIIHAARSPSVEFLAVAFPQLKFHMTYHLRKPVPPDSPGRPPESRRECALVVHRPVDTYVFHGILTTLPLKCWPERVKDAPRGPRMVQAKTEVAWNGRANGITTNGTNGVVHVKQERTASPSVPPSVESDLKVIGLMNGITDIRFLPAGRLLDRKRRSPAVRYYHRMPTDVSLQLEFTQDDRTVQSTLHELSQIFKRPIDKPVVKGQQNWMRLSCHDVPTRVYHALVLAICRIIPDANHDMRIVIYLDRTESLSFPRFEDTFAVAVRLFSDLWHQIPVSRRDDRGKRGPPPLFSLMGFTRDDVRLEGTIRSRLNDGGETFTADVRSRDARGDNVYRSSSYPALFPKP